MRLSPYANMIRPFPEDSKTRAEVIIEIPGPPVGKSHTVAGRKITLTKETRGFMKFVRTLAKLKAPPEPWPGAVAAHIHYVIEPHPSWDADKKARALAGTLYATVTPDGDNVSKSVCDALSKVVYKDDRQIVDYRITKCYGPEAKTVVTITELEHLPAQKGLF